MAVAFGEWTVVSRGSSET